MEIYLTRKEIRSIVRSTMGQTDNDTLGGLTLLKLNNNIASASIKASADCSWLAKQKRATIDIGTAQYKVAWPSDAALGDLLEASMWDPVMVKNFPLKKASLPTEIDLDQVAALGGADFLALQGRPEWIDPRQDYLWLYPANDDTPRKLIMAYNVQTRLVDDTTKSLCDGQLIVAWTLALMNRDDVGERQLWQGQYADRLAKLKEKQNTGRGVPVDHAYARRNLGYYPPGSTGIVPNWDTRPRT
jgi:hypothetical protein